MSGKLVFLDDVRNDRLATRPAKESQQEVSQSEKIAPLSLRRAQMIAHIRACAFVAFAASEHTPEHIIEASTRTLPGSGGIYDISGLQFRDEQDMHDLLDDKLTAHIVSEFQGEWLESTKRDIETIAQARAAGLEPGQIISVADLRSTLAVNRVYQGMERVVPGARQRISEIMKTLERKSSQKGVKAIPVARAMTDLGGLCVKMSGNLGELSRYASRIAGVTKDYRTRAIGLGKDALTVQTRAIFRPFTDGARIETAKQLIGMRDLIGSAQPYYVDTAYLLNEAKRMIEYYDAIGDHKSARAIEETLRPDEITANLESSASALNEGLATYYSIVAEQGIKSGALLRSVPSPALTEALSESGLLDEAEAIRQKQLVESGDNDLRLR